VRLKNCGVAVIENFATRSVYIILRAVYGEVEEFRVFINFHPTKIFNSFHVSHKKKAVTVFCWIFVRCFGADHRFFAMLRCSRPSCLTPVLLFSFAGI